jgi:hypothetical protein
MHNGASLYSRECCGILQYIDELPSHHSSNDVRHISGSAGCIAKVITEQTILTSDTKKDGSK